MTSEAELPVYTEEYKDWLIKECGRVNIDGTGKLNKDELNEVLEFCGFYFSDEGLNSVLRSYDTDKDGKLTKQQIVDNIDTIHQHSIDGEKMVKIFRNIDKEKKGYIRLPQLRDVFCNGPNAMTGEESGVIISQIVKQFDKDGDGKFIYPEFVRIMKSDLVKNIKEKYIPQYNTEKGKGKKK